nr:zinc finger BED domain-containing protein RICESLEEPER 2-like [Ipomoea batatas]
MVAGGVLTRRKRRGPPAKDVNLGVLVSDSRVTVLGGCVIHTVVDSSYDCDLRVGWFREWSLLDFESSTYEDFSEVDLMFFPIIRLEHYFLLYFDFRHFRLEIIDNSSSTRLKKDKYGECLVDMQDMLQEFCTKSHPGRSVLCAGLEPKSMQMSWREFNNKIDCGVYLMRHMETFTGQVVSRLDCGLVKGEYSMLHKLRLQYMKDLVMSDYNLHRSRNLARPYQSINAPFPAV